MTNARRFTMTALAMALAAGTAGTASIASIGCDDGQSPPGGGAIEDNGALSQAPAAKATASVAIADVKNAVTARGAIDSLRKRHVFAAPKGNGNGAIDPAALPTPSRNLQRALNNPARLPSAVAAAQPVLGQSLSVRFRTEGNALIPTVDRDTTATDKQDAANAAADWRLALATKSTQGFQLRDGKSGVALTSRLRGVRPADAEVTDGYVIYRNAAPAGGTMIHRIVEDGTEDFITLEERPVNAEVSYDVDLGDKVAGLRLVGRTLEALDASGTPRLRVSPPYLVDAGGRKWEAELAVTGCAVDTDPSAPWDRRPVAPGASHCQVHITWDDRDVLYPAILDPSWVTTANMATARARPTVNTLSTGNILVAGGTADLSNSLNTCELFNASNNTWAATGSMASRRVDHRANTILTSPNKILVTGGYDLSPGTYPRAAESYNPTTGTWTTHAQMVHGRRSHTSTRLSTGDILVVGGNVDVSPSQRSVERFNVSNSTWTTRADLLNGQSFHTATLLNNNNLLVVGGTASPTAQIYNPTNNSWAATASPNVPRYSHAAVLLTSGSNNGKVLIVGGQDINTEPTRAAEVFDPAGSGSWVRTGATMFDHWPCTATRLSGDRVVVIGDSFATAGKSAEIWNPTWGTWTYGPSNSGAARLSHGVAVLNDGRLLVAGGSAPALSPPIPINTAIRFDPAATAVSVAEYKFAATQDNAVLSNPMRMTEVWGVLHRPTTLPSGRLPVLLFLHGNHDTCGTGSNPRVDNDSSYTFSGTCPSGYVPTPNHRGYDYIASELAARGFIVASINANRGITGASDGPFDDWSLILPRGRLILRHLDKLSRWNRNVEATPGAIGVSLANKLDLTQVGLMGHSRGGEGVRAAYDIYKKSGSIWPGIIVDPVTFRGLFEIGPVDHIGTLNAPNTRWNVLLPICDGDVSSLSGVLPFDRMMALTETTIAPKSTYTVWGANHNYFNTEWQIGDGFCGNHRPLFPNNGPGITGSAEQRGVGLQAMVAFFKGFMSTSPVPSFNNQFNPEEPISFGEPIIDRGYTPGLSTAQSKVLEEFAAPTGVGSFALPNTHSNITISHENLPEHDVALRGANISWTTNGAFFQTNFANVGSGINLSAYQLLDMRVDRADDPALNIAPATDFYVQLVTSNNTVSGAVNASFHGGPFMGPANNHSMLQTIRIPLSDFGVPLTAIRAVRLLFAVHGTGHLYIANIRATRTTAAAPLVAISGEAGTDGATGAAGAIAATRAARAAAWARPYAVTASTGRPAPQVVLAGNVVRDLRTSPDKASIEVELSSPTPFLSRDAALVLRVGKSEARWSFSPGGDSKKVVFRMDRKAWEAVADGDQISVAYGGGHSDVEWLFGAIDKSRLVP